MAALEDAERAIDVSDLVRGFDAVLAPAPRCGPPRRDASPTAEPQLASQPPRWRRASTSTWARSRRVR
jgi:hypothetical protein